MNKNTKLHPLKFKISKQHNKILPSLITSPPRFFVSHISNFQYSKILLSGVKIGRKISKKKKKRNVSTREIAIIAVNPSIPFAIPTLPPFIVASQSKRRTNDYFTWKQAGEDVTSTPFTPVKGGRAHRENTATEPSPLSPACRSPLWISLKRDRRRPSMDATKTSVHGSSLASAHPLFSRPTRNATSNEIFPSIEPQYPRN